MTEFQRLRRGKAEEVCHLSSFFRTKRLTIAIFSEDMFGADDADWAIYRKINIAAPSSDEEDDIAQLQAIEQKLLTYDPSFTVRHTHASITTQRSALVSAFRPTYDEGDVEGTALPLFFLKKKLMCLF